MFVLNANDDDDDDEQCERERENLFNERNNVDKMWLSIIKTYGNFILVTLENPFDLSIFKIYFFWGIFDLDFYCFMNILSNEREIYLNNPCYL